ncbi:MAG: hypothetical protein H6934_09565 [Burkholderiaceae bacterium]|nr:hypothetical protein [Burkholderiaceae bacterium]
MKSTDAELPSNRKFGALFTAVFLVAGWYFSGGAAGATMWVFGGLAAATGIATLAKPDVLMPLNRLWMRLGMILGAIVSPVVLGIIYFAIFTPIAVMMRLAGRDELRLKLTNAKSHWRLRERQEAAAESFKRQF